MAYFAETSKIVALLDDIAARGFLSAPQPHPYLKGEMSRFATFTDDENLEIRGYLARYLRVLRAIRYRQDSMFSEHEQWSAPLLQMLTYMLDGKSTNPDYVAANAQRLSDALTSHAEQFAAVDFDVEMKSLTEVQ